ncbi:hypothetical protein MUP77_11360 [Candidatus Bathyarchaeota archaeon]|nr:hypothetical protein [Candidatus Bathyarchaeota archaeon]
MFIRNLSTISTLFKPGQDPFVVVSYGLFLVFFLTSLYFFIFSIPFTRPKVVSYITKVGRWCLMAMLSVYFGSTTQNRLEMTPPAFMFLLLGI